jgi:hypothetical protein
MPPQAILVSDLLISKKSSPLKPLGQMNRNLAGSILGRSSIKNAQQEWPVEACLLTDQDEMSSIYRGLAIDASYQVSVLLAKWFQRRRFKKIGQSETNPLTSMPPQAILVSDLLISKKSSPLKPLGQMNRNLVGRIIGRSSIMN